MPPPHLQHFKMSFAYVQASTVSDKSVVIYMVVPKCAFLESLKIFFLSLLVRVYLDVVFLLVWLCCTSLG